jgi:hypothetical protein
MNSCMFPCIISHIIGLQVVCTGTIVETLLSYSTYGEFPCCLVSVCLDFVGAVVYMCFEHNS